VDIIQTVPSDSGPFNVKFLAEVVPMDNSIKCTFASKEVAMTLEEAKNFYDVLGNLIRIVSKKKEAVDGRG